MFQKLKDTNNTYIIAEVGQNHQGSLENALEFIDRFKMAGADAVKFQVRNNKYLFSKEAYDKDYDSENAFAKTYGAHREALELSLEEVKTIRNYCKDNNIDYIVTPFDEPSLEFLETINVDAYKIASFDLGNLPFINKIAATKKPVVISVGGGEMDHIKASVECILKCHNEIALLHCVSKYPCPENELNLEQIASLINMFPDLTIGSSDHFNGILSGPLAYMLGARVFEKHVTLNRAWTGTDHSFALEPEGFRKMVRDIKRTPEMISYNIDPNLGKEPVFQKLGKSLVAGKDIKKGDVFNLDNLSGTIFTDNITPVRDSMHFIDKFASEDITKGTPLTINHIEK